MAYLYKHIRKSNGEIFYIGIGSDQCNKYSRAYSKHNRTKYWRHIVSKDDYIVEIILDDLTWEEACEKEREFIELYGRKDLNNGILVNMTKGGEGVLGLKHTEKTIKKIKEKLSRKVECPHCNKSGSIINMKRYHFDNCKIITGKSKHKGHAISQETRDKIGKSNAKSQLGKKHSEATLKKMRGLRKSYKIDIEIALKIIELYKTEDMTIEEITRRVNLSYPTILKFLKENKLYKKERPIKECPHCKIKGGGSNMKRYHFDNCKLKKID